MYQFIIIDITEHDKAYIIDFRSPKYLLQAGSANFEIANSQCLAPASATIVVKVANPVTYSHRVGYILYVLCNTEVL